MTEYMDDTNDGWTTVTKKKRKEPRPPAKPKPYYPFNLAIHTGKRLFQRTKKSTYTIEQLERINDELHNPPINCHCCDSFYVEHLCDRLRINYNKYRCKLDDDCVCCLF